MQDRERGNVRRLSRRLALDPHPHSLTPGASMLLPAGLAWGGQLRATGTALTLQLGHGASISREGQTHCFGLMTIKLLLGDGQLQSFGGQDT